MLLIDSITVPRTWRERLWSWPWRPWVRITKRDVPSRQVYQMANVIVMHPEHWETLKRQNAQ